MNIGSRHPISIVKNQMIDIFSTIGFNVSEGPEIEDDWHNFTALNLPEYHPARDMQDTFWLKKLSPEGERLLLRTQTSAVQVRYMEKHKPPGSPGPQERAYRMISSIGLDAGIKETAQIITENMEEGDNERVIYWYEVLYHLTTLKVGKI
jgi:hypothetical protein